MRTISWSLALLALAVGGTLAGCKSSHDGTSDGGLVDAGDGGSSGTPGFQVTGAVGLQTTEAGGQATFRIALNTRPTADVKLSLSSTATDEGAVSPAQITFTPADYSSERIVTITGVDDTDVDGNQSYKISFAGAESTDALYAGLKPADIDVTNVDNESAGLIFTGTTGLTTSEPDNTATFKVRLATKPTANVVLNMASSDPGEVTVAPAAVTFTPDDWNGDKTVTLMGVDDAEVDGPQTVAINLAKLVSNDTRYAAIEPPDVSVTNNDDESVQFIVRPSTGLATHENGQQASFTVRLNTRPTANVTVGISSSDTSEVTVSPAELTFTPDNWRSPSSVVVTGVDDSDPDGNQTFTIVTSPSASGDARFNGVDAADVTGINVDDDTPGVSVIADPALEVAENGGQATFYVVLNKQPSEDVTVPVSSSNPDKATAGPDSLVFTQANWSAPHTVTVTGVNNTIKDGTVPVNVVLGAATSADAGYAGIDPTDVTVSVVDDDGPGLTIVEADNFTTTETGGQTTFTVRLNSRPAADVTVPLLSTNTAEIMVSPAGLTFTADDWNSPHSVTLTGVNDVLLDGDQAVDIRIGPTTSSDPEYLSLTQLTVTATNADDDAPGVTVNPALGLLTSESGLQDSFTVVLDHPPTKDVSFALSVSKPGEASMAPTTLTFTTANWNAPQTVTLTGLDDADPVADGPQVYWVAFARAVSEDVDYNGFAVPNVLAVNNDNDTPGVSFVPVAGSMNTSEAGGQATFTLALDSKPTGTVVLNLSSSDTSEGTVSPATLTFDNQNWSSTQLVTVSGVNDDADDGVQAYAILVDPQSTDDENYDALIVPNIALNNTDGDSAGVTITPRTLITTTEASGPSAQQTFTVVLDTEPVGVVTIPLASSRTAEATVSPASLTFTTSNWNAPQTVTVTGQGDLAPDGNQLYNINIGPITGDPKYAALSVPSLAGQNIDNDSATVTVIGNNLVTTEAGGTASFGITLGSDPMTTVTIPITVSRPAEAQLQSMGLVTTLNLTFDSNNYTALQTVVVQGVNDDTADGNQPYRIHLGPAVSTNPNYAGKVLPSLDGTNNDNDSAGITVTATEPLVTDEFATTDSFTVVLNSQPTQPVTIPVSVSNDEATASTMLLTFLTSNWDSAQTVTITGQDDAIADGSQPYAVLLGPAASSDPNYGGRTIPNVSGFNTDNDSPGLTVVAASVLNTSEDSNVPAVTFTIALNSRPTADVTVNIGSTDPSEGSVDNPALTFTPASYGAQTVTVRGVNDDLDDLDQPYQFTISATSTDPNYVRIAPNLDALNADDDTAGFTLAGQFGLVVQEPNGSATFTLRLRSQPTAPVTIPLSVDDATEISVSPVSLTFSAANWSTSQTITVTSVNDDVADGVHSPEIAFGPISSDDATYAALGISNVSVDNLDDDSAAVVLSPLTPSLDTFEVGTTDSFTIVLNSEPSATTTINISSSDTTEATVTPAAVEFNALNWNVPQTVTVMGVQDTPAPILDGDVAYTIDLSSPVGAGEYSILPSRSVPGVNWEAFLSCNEVATLQPAAPSGSYWLDTDRTGPLAKFRVYCDLDTDGGGWTLLSWTADSSALDGPPYPGLVYCATPTSCSRGSGVPSIAEANALFQNSMEFGQGQAITAGNTKTTIDDLETYEFAGAFTYSTLSGLSLEGTSGTCAPLTTGTYATISDGAMTPNRNDGTPVFLNQALRLDSTAGDYANDSNNYNWSIGNRTGYCATNGTPPASVLGTWQASQYGPAFQNAAGSYSVWVR